MNIFVILRPLARAVIWLGLSFAFYPNVAVAESYKCTDAQGNLLFSDTPCQTDSQSETLKLPGTAPAPPKPTKPTAFNPEDYCQVVFEADYTGKEYDSERTLQVKKGEKMLAGSFGSGNELDKLFYLTDVGVIGYRLNWMGLNWLEQLPGRENKPPPPHRFTCQSTEVLKNGGKMTKTMTHTKLLVVLHDVNLYLDKELKQLACRLTAGTTLELGSSMGSSAFPADKTEDDSSEYSLGHLEMDTLPSICNGHSSGYFKMKKTPAGAASPWAMFLWKVGTAPAPAQPKPEERSYQCVDKSGEFFSSEQPCPAEYTAQKVGIPDNLKNHCIAVFKRDYSYVDESTGWKIDVKKGEELLLSSKSSKDSFMPTNFAYLTDQGAVILPNNGEEDDSKLFSSNCDSKQTKSVFVAFGDLTLYSDAALETQACQLKTGKIIDISSPYSFGGGLATTSLTLDSLAPLCNGHKTVHYKWKQTNLGHATPFWLLLAPQ